MVAGSGRFCTRVMEVTGGKAWIEIAVTEGRNRQVRRMLEAVGVRTEKLRRTRIGTLHLGKLPSGALRRLTAREVGRLQALVGLAV